MLELVTSGSFPRQAACSACVARWGGGRVLAACSEAEEMLAERAPVALWSLVPRFSRRRLMAGNKGCQSAQRGGYCWYPGGSDQPSLSGLRDTVAGVGVAAAGTLLCV